MAASVFTQLILSCLFRTSLTEDAPSLNGALMVCPAAMHLAPPCGRPKSTVSLKQTSSAESFPVTEHFTTVANEIIQDAVTAGAGPFQRLSPTFEFLRSAVPTPGYFKNNLGTL